MSSNHGPGPWQSVEHFSDGVHDGHIIVDANGHKVATVWHQKHMASEAVTAKEDANVQLLTSAPTLAGALKRILQITGSTGGSKSLVEEYRNIAILALAEAGESNPSLAQN